MGCSCRGRTVRERLAEMTRSRSWTTAAVERSSDRAKGQLPGLAANSPSRQEADTHERPAQAFEVIPRNTQRGAPVLALTWSSTTCVRRVRSVAGMLTRPGQVSKLPAASRQTTPCPTRGRRLPPSACRRVGLTSSRMRDGTGCDAIVR